MARPVKQGVDYFPLDVYLDDKFKFIEIKYNLEGFAIVVKLMQRIYSQGYWCKWTEDELLLFSDEIKTDHELVQGVVDECLKRGVFDKRLHDNHNILTSKGIQKRYQEITRRRKDVEVTEEYQLIEGLNGVIDDINPSSTKHNDNIVTEGGQQHDVKSTQSKVNRKETKQKEQIPYAEIIEYLNEKADKKYKSSANKTRDMIHARWQEGNRLDDFKKVIDVCCQKWSGQIFNNGQKGDDYLRPSTLFNGKFDERLNWSTEKQELSSGPQKSREQIEHEKMLDEVGYFD